MSNSGLDGIGCCKILFGPGKAYGVWDRIFKAYTADTRNCAGGALHCSNSMYILVVRMTRSS